MRNLRLTKRLSFHNDDLEHAQFVCADADTDDVYVATHTSLWKLNARSSSIYHCIDIPQNGSRSKSNYKSGPVIALSYLSEQQDACIVTDYGDLYLYNNVEQELTCIGSVESGLQAAVWSPDGDIFVLATGELRLILMTRNFLPIEEVPIFSEDFGESKPVTVGWGKKETQFHGSEGKTAATVQKDPLSCVLPWDDRKPRISWRGDGQLFAVSAVDPVSDARKIRIFNRDGTLQATSEDVIGLEAEMSWRPSGSVIASVQRLPEVYQVVFFEKNGLRHREFALPTDSKEAIVKDLAWNTDSTLLSVWLDYFVPDKPAKVLIWTMNNYHWYLKQTLLLPMGSELRNVLWDTTFPLVLHCLTSGNYLQFNWGWEVNHSQQTTSKDSAAAAVIDGAKLLITPFRTVLIPPPLCAYELSAPCPVSQVVFSTAESSVNLAAVLADNRIVFYEEVPRTPLTCSKENDAVRKPSGENDFNTVFGKHFLKAIFNLKWSDEPSTESHLPLYLHHWQWPRATTMFAVYTNGNVSAICKILIDNNMQELLICSTKYVEGLVGQTCPSSDGQSLFLELEDGKLLSYSIDNDTLSPWTAGLEKEISLLHFCATLRCVSIAGKDMIIGLTERYRLFCNNMELLNNATSFAVANNFLLVTTLDHKLKCIPLQFLKEISMQNGESERSVERGSRIVLVVPEDTKVVLQMPRGNLETIHPRALVLSVVGNHLNSLQFHTAFTLMRSHRINMNLMHDHNPQLFLESVDKFVAEVNNVNWLNIFLSELQDEDVTTTLYSAMYPGRLESSSEGLGKVNRICRAVKTSLDKNESKYLLSILTSLVMMKPPELDSALNLIKSFKDQQDNKVSIDEALGYLTYLVDVNSLYNVALGTYDFDLVIMVAQQSQKDPKEYLPFLNDLRKMEPNYQKFVIDCHLKKSLKALEHISHCGEKYYNECLDYIRNNNLYSYALKLFSPNSEQYKAICTAYGDYLSERHRHDEAGLFFHRADKEDLALASFEKSLNWEKAVSTATILKLGDNHLQDLASRMAARLKDQHQHKDAAYLLEQYVKDYQESIITLLEGPVWELALEKIYFHNCENMIASHLIPRLLEHCATTISAIECQNSTLSKYTSRLLLIREQKSSTVQDPVDVEGLPSDVASDISSVTGFTQASTASRATSRATARTSKNRRKHERKKQSLKEGSPYEDLALLDALTALYSSVEKIREECSSTINMLVYFGHDNEAQQLNRCFKSLIDSLKNDQKRIWPPTVVASDDPLTGPDTTANSIAASMLQQASPCSSTDYALLVPPKTRLDHRWQIDFFAQ